MSTTKRTCETQTVSLTDDIATTPEIVIDGFTSGFVAIPALSSITSLTFYAQGEAAQDAGGAVVRTVQASRAYQLPPAVFGSSTMKIVVDVVGDVLINLKS